jgi:hypothetical protein
VAILRLSTFDWWVDKRLAPARLTPPVGSTALRRTDVFAFETRSAILETRPHLRALPPPRTTWAKSANHVYSVLQSKCPLRDLCQWIRGKEMEMIENCQNKADCAGVSHCQITTYDRKAEVQRER